MLIDVHTRVWESPELLGASAAEFLRRRIREPWNPPDATPDSHHKATGALRFVVIHGLVSQAGGAKLGLDLLAKYVGRQPDRFLGSAGIDPMVNGCLEHVDRAAGMGMIGATISPAFQNFHPT
ncbi:MAG: hypothetical protein IT442_15860, partial [Phycisphaeraceae bacterium]|nr:hypothetical protein [Phycisphaeraceae bacterium]